MERFEQIEIVKRDCFKDNASNLTRPIKRNSASLMSKDDSNSNKNSLVPSRFDLFLKDYENISSIEKENDFSYESFGRKECNPSQVCCISQNESQSRLQCIETTLTSTNSSKVEMPSPIVKTNELTEIDDNTCPKLQADTNFIQHTPLTETPLFTATTTKSNQLNEVNTNSANTPSMDQNYLLTLPLNELLLLCKVYRDKVLSDANPEDITTLQTINDIIDSKLNPADPKENGLKLDLHNVTSPFKESNQIIHSHDQPCHDVNNSLQYSDNFDEIQAENRFLDYLKQSVEQSKQTPTLNFVHEEEPSLPMDLGAIQFVPIHNSSIFLEEEKKTTFNNDLLRDLELKPLKVRKVMSK